MLQVGPWVVAARQIASDYKTGVAPEWILRDDARRIERFDFAISGEALAFVQRVGELAETEGRTSSRHQFRLGLCDRLVEHQKDQGTARERFHHGQQNRSHALVISIRGVPVFGGPAF